MKLGAVEKDMLLWKGQIVCVCTVKKVWEARDPIIRRGKICPWLLPYLLSHPGNKKARQTLEGCHFARKREQRIQSNIRHICLLFIKFPLHCILSSLAFLDGHFSPRLIMVPALEKLNSGAVFVVFFSPREKKPTAASER